MGLPVRFEFKRELTVYFVATFAVSWLLWLPAFLIQNHGLFLPFSYDLFLKAGSFGPSVLGFILAYVFGGKAGLYSLFRSMLNNHIKPKWLFFAFLVLPGVSAVSFLIITLSGGSLPQLQFKPWFIPVAFAYILVFMGPLGEEAGWRGFTLKRIMRNFTPLMSAVLIGIVWSLWHLPLFFINGTTQNALTEFGLLPALFCYLLYTVMISILITLLYIKSNGSVLGSILFHTMGNLSLGFVPLIFSKSGAVVLLLVLCATSASFIYIYREAMLSKVGQKL
ncbi:MAG: hypothetical protein CVU91_04245 [Firmicutes bacterium HGW-Firmicutes-16]|nr:MAG: hypothetical protein CVU91_04245 [Firmicutes bacterium HGW-Firmicutes-16]